MLDKRGDDRPSVVATWLLSIVWPIGAARRAEGVGWVSSWVMCGVAAAVSMPLMVWVSASIGELSVVEGLAVVVRDGGPFLDALMGGREWVVAWIAVAAVPVMGLAGVFVAAFALMAMGSRDEAFGAAYRRMLKRLLVTSPWVIGATAAVGGVALAAYVIGMGWQNEYELPG